MSKQLLLFEKLPRKPAIKRMHFIDVGCGCVEMECDHCGYESGWIDDEGKSVSEIKKGFPCPKCNPHLNISYSEC